MSKVIYAKYNRTRDPRYQTSTKIYRKDDGTRYVTKEPLKEEAAAHVLSFPQKVAMSEILFESMKPIPVEIEGNTAIFPYMEGSRARDYLENYSHDFDLLMDKIRELADRLFLVNPDKTLPFVLSPEFINVFGEFNPPYELMAARGLNVDMIFDNIILREDRSEILDYEWTYDFPIPVDFARFRTLFHYYDSNKVVFADRISLEDYLVRLGISRDLVEPFMAMEAKFQFSVHGEGARYIYTGRYQQRINRFPDDYMSRDQFDDLQREAEYLRHEIKDLRKSFSWRISSPVRTAADTAVSLKQKATIASKLIYPEKMQQGLAYLKENGLAATISHTKEVLSGGMRAPYIFEEISPQEEEAQRKIHFAYEPMISILVPLYNTPRKFLMEMIESVVNQTYGNWELCLADGSDKENLRPVIGKYKKKDSRIKYMKLKSNRGISENTNACIKMASGDFIGLFDHDDLLTRDALYRVVEAINTHEGTEIVYTDEDKLLTGSKGQNQGFIEPHYKPDFNLDLLRTCNYICHFFVVRKTVAERAGGFRKECDGSQDYDFILRCSEQTDRIVHVPRILYHWRIHSNSTAADPKNKMYCYEAGEKAVKDHLVRKGILASVKMRDQYGFYKVNYDLKETSLVSMIITNPDQAGDLKRCIESICQQTNYNNYEIMVPISSETDQAVRDYLDSLKDDERIRLVETGKDNLPAICNSCADQAAGDYLVFLDSRTEIIDSDWILKMLSNCQREKVAVVAPKILYPDDTIENMGLILGLKGIAGPAFRGLNRKAFGYNGRGISQQNLSAVTSSCMMISKAVFEEVGGMEEALKEAFYDVDLCLKVGEEGYLLVLNPDVECRIHRVKSNGDDVSGDDRFSQAPEVEEEYMKTRWSDLLQKGDPCYNENLTLLYTDFSLKGPEE